MSDPTECVFVDSDTTHSRNPSTMLPELRSTDQSARRTPAGQQPRIVEQVLESSHSINRQQAQDARHRGWYGPEGQWCRKRVEEQARRVDVEVSVEYGTATNWDDAGKGVDHLIVLVRDVEVDAESGTTATVNRDRLPLIPRKEESYRVLHEALSRQQFHFRRASKHRVLDRSEEPHRRLHQRRDAVFHSDLTGHTADADCRGIIPCTSYSRTNDYVKLWLRHCVQLYAQQHHA